jgi:uncharacterized protein YaiI (UPF0178 family)
MTRKLPTFLLVVFASVGLVAQTRYAAGRLQVSATVVSSSQLVQQPDGSFRLLVANAPSRADAADMQIVANQLNPDVKKVQLQDTSVAASAPAPAARKRKSRQ